MRQRRRTYGALVPAIVTAVLVSLPGAASAAPAVPAGPTATTSDGATAASDGSSSAPSRTLTLVTGDRVTSSAGRVSVAPRRGMTFLRFRRGTDDYVIPADAVPLLRADRLDERLFNVTQLLADKFDQRADLPLIVSDNAGLRGLTAQHRLAAVDGYTTKVAVSGLAKNWPTLRTSLTTGKLWLDGVREPALDVSVPQSGAPVAWAAGFDGTGVKVAVLDSGIDATHPDFAGRIIAQQNFVPEYEPTEDLVGHGTHVASTVAGSGAASDGKYRGMAPGANLLIGKICFAYGLQAACPDSAILAGMYWAAQSGARVVNMSLGADDQPGIDPIEQAVNDLTAEYGTLFVVAAGNSGYSPQTVGSPASADAALAVGNVDKSGARNPSSGQGPRLGDYAVKPEITAPGTDIVAARSSYATGIAPPGEQYVSFTGTSMATPHVTGAAAILAQAHPDWRAPELKAALMSAARPSADIDVFGQGAGQLDVGKALRQPVRPSPSAVNFGFRAYPHGTDDVVTQTLTYHNDSDQPKNLRLALNGSTAPAGLVTLDATSVTVPANGDASVHVRADTHAGGDAYGAFGGRIVATGENFAVQTPFSVFRERPSADAHVNVLDRDGTPAGSVVTQFGNVTSGEFFLTYEPTSTLRLPLGTYFVLSLITGADGTYTLLANSRLVIDGTANVTLDGRRAKKLDIQVPDRSAAPVGGLVDVRYLAGPKEFGGSLIGDPSTLYTADLGPRDVDGVATEVTALFAKPDGQGGFAGSPYTYQTGWSRTGSFITGFSQHLKKSDLATVRAEYARAVPDSTGLRTNYGVLPGFEYPTGFGLPNMPLPGRRTEYYAGNLSWQQVFDEATGTGDPYYDVLTELNAPERSYRAGRSYAEPWNQAVFTLPMTPDFPEYPIVERRNNELLLRLGGYADAAGNHGYTNSNAGGTMTLRRDGEQIAEGTGAFYGLDLPDGDRARYRLEYSFDQAAPVRLATKVDTVWEFDSAYTEQGTALPLTAVGFAPQLDLDNTTRNRLIAPVPLTFTRQAGAGKLSKVEVEVSYNDGKSWTKAPVLSVLGQYTALVVHPLKGGFVSLRAHATDNRGAAVTTTVIRAYEVR